MNEKVKKGVYENEFDLAYQGVLNAYEALSNMRSFETRKKADKTFVTDADVLVEKILIDAIKEKYPTDNLLTEETNNQNSLTNRTWVIDPIDGTNHFMRNSIFWGIQLAFFDKGETQFSMIYLPKLNEFYYAIKGQGAFLNHTKIELNEPREFAQCIVEFGGSPRKFYEEKQKVVEKLILSDDRVAGLLHVNSCCISFTNLVLGRTDGLIASTRKPWDVMPGIMLAKEAGFEPVTVGNLTIYTKNNEITKKIIEI